MHNPGTVFVEIRILRDAPMITGWDMKTYGPFRKGRVYAIPKENARVFIKHRIAEATRKEAEKPTLKEMFKGEVLTPYIEAAKVKPLAEEPLAPVPTKEDKLLLKRKAKQAQELADRFLDTLDYCCIDEIYLIGSRAKGTAKPTSDWDFLIFIEDDGDRIEEARIEKGFNVDIKPGQVDIIFSSKRPVDISIKVYDAKREKTYAVPRKSWMGTFTAKTDEEAVLKQIAHNIKFWKTGICKRETLETYCREKGIENVTEILRKLIRQGDVYMPREGYLGLTEPEKYGLPSFKDQG